jgi:hypothetical protein
VRVSVRVCVRARDLCACCALCLFLKKRGGFCKELIRRFCPIVRKVSVLTRIRSKKKRREVSSSFFFWGGGVLFFVGPFLKFEFSKRGCASTIVDFQTRYQMFILNTKTRLEKMRFFPKNQSQISHYRSIERANPSGFENQIEHLRRCVV